MWISRWRRASARADLEAVLGPLAMFEMSGGGYGCKLTSEVLFPVSTAYAPIAGLWTVRRLGLTPIEVMELARGEILPLPVPADRTPPPMPDIGLAIRAPPPPPT